MITPTHPAFPSALIPISLGLLLSLSCHRPSVPEPDETILVRVGDKTISLNEFIRRAEYTPRPPYCNSDNYIHKKIVLNSLIAEKLLAIEAGNNNPLVENEQFRAFIKGRREQAMRQWLYHTEAYQQVRLDTSDIKRVYQRAGRRYRVAFFTLLNQDQADSARAALLENPDAFDPIYRAYSQQPEPPIRDISWEEPHADQLRHALYLQPVSVNQVIGPIVTEDNEYLFMKVLGWRDRIDISEQGSRQRWNDVVERLTSRQADRLFEQYMSEVMQGKQVQFVDHTFWRLVRALAPIYLKVPDEDKEILKQTFWSEVNPEFAAGQRAGSLFDYDRNQPFFAINDQLMTVGDFLDMVKSHPLVFRKKTFDGSGFPEQFKLAVVDLIRDQYLTEEAHRKGYDQVNMVERNTNLWHDYLQALYAKYEYLERIGYEDNFSSNYLSAISQYLNPYIDSLQAKYNDIIVINTDMFEEIELTRIDLFAIQPQAAYPIVVPDFPLITTDSRLDYGRKSE